MVLCYLEDNLILLPQVSIVGVDEHELVVVGHVVVLVDLLLLSLQDKRHLLSLNQELSKKRHRSAG